MDNIKVSASEGTAKTPLPKRKKHIDKEELAGTLLASVPLIGFVLFGLIPLIMAFAMAFFKMQDYALDATSKWIGLDNFKFVLTDPMFWESVVNTLILGSSVLISQVFALVIAYLLSREIKGKKAFRMIFFIPYVCSVVAITLMWKYMFNTNYGIINIIIGRTGDNAIDWLGDSAYFSWAVIIMSVWSGMGYGIILYTAALTGVNRAMTEAAEIDGAGPFTKFFKIVLPTISPTTFYLLVMGIIGALQSFAVTNVLAQGGGPNGDGITIVFYLYRNVFKYTEMGRASATAWILAFMILVVTVLQFVFSKWVNYEND
ncbi:MAG: sugar ABC transporter permease [Clostridia bacterium]|nr:sugar ABC transporter permease [Clostridia bacterium]